MSDGFYIYSDLRANEVEEAAADALRRMKRGESHLAVSPLCGTNLAVGGTLAGLAALVAVGSGDRWERLPNVLTAAMLAVLAGQPIGRLGAEVFDDVAGFGGDGDHGGAAGRERASEILEGGDVEGIGAVAGPP